MWNPAPPGSEQQSLRGIRPLTDAFIESTAARFSADGQWLLFHAAPPRQPAHIYLAQLRMNVDGTVQGLHRPIQVSPDHRPAGTGCFSPDGQSLYFACAATAEPSPQAWPPMRLYRADGWQGAVAALAPGAAIDLAQHPIIAGEAFNGEVSTAPQGHWLIFTSTRPGPAQIYAAALDGSNPRRLTRADTPSGWPSVSPNGRQLLFQQQIDGQSRIMLADLTFDSAGQPIGLTHLRSPLETPGFCPSWHPDGRHLLYAAAAPDGDTELYIIRTDGSRPTRLTFTPGADLLPAVSPDGHGLVWTSARGPDHTPQLYFAYFQLPEGS
jgi:Tol biopolymer transport system component